MSLQDDINNLQSVIAQNSGDSINDFGGAIQNLQSAGNNAVGSIGPAIDKLSGGNPQVMTMTQWAWQKNGTLASVKSDDSASKDDLSSAVSMLKQMVDWYGQAYRLALSLQHAQAATPAPSPHQTVYQPPPAKPVTPPAPPINPQSNTGKKFGIPKVSPTGAGVGIGAIIGFAVGGPIGAAGGAMVGGAIGSLFKGKV